MSSLDNTLQANLRLVHERISSAARSVQRTADSILLVAVSKTFAAEAIVAAAGCGQRDFAENYVQEAVAKIARVRELAPLPLQWHFIGPIQSNKTRAIAEHFDWVQSVDRLRIAQRLSEQRADGRPPLNVLLQVNISGEATKSGARADEVPALASAIATLPRLALRGLMAIPEPEPDPERRRAPFARMRRLFDELRARGLPLDTLSMGMSDDLEAAIAEGATMVRVGSAIFGQRR
ncbi:MAG: YggS family pyridoxal phosphate-dependent enzyme [Gemmatimonadota bacterium]